LNEGEIQNLFSESHYYNKPSNLLFIIAVATPLITSIVNGKAFSLILFLALFHIVFSCILFRKSCPSHVNEPTLKA